MSLTPTAATPLAELIESGRDVVGVLHTEDSEWLRRVGDLIEQLVERCHQIPELQHDAEKNQSVADDLQLREDNFLEEIRDIHDALNTAIFDPQQQPDDLDAAIVVMKDAARDLRNLIREIL